jgi:hypothetical protein
MDDDGFNPFLEGPRRRWGESEYPVLDDWPMPGQPTLYVVPDPEPEAAIAEAVAPEALSDGRVGDPSRNPDGSLRNGWWQGGTPPRWVDRPTPPKPSRLEIVRQYLRTLARVDEEILTNRERRSELPPWEK